MDRRHGERRVHMPVSVPRTCAEVITNDGGDDRGPSRRERPCGDDAAGYCSSCARYVCSIHWQSRHAEPGHDVARR
jgi:hypothetical protein